MLYTNLLSYGSLAALLPIVSGANIFCKGGVHAIVASALAKFEPAESHCSKVFPLPMITSTITASTTTLTRTVATQSPITTVAIVTDTITPVTETVTVTSDTQTDSATITVDTSTVTVFSEATATSTSTVFTVSIIAKRDAEPELIGRHNPHAASEWSSVQKKGKPFVGSICTCLQTPVTNYATTTPSTTISVTATSPVSVAATSTATITATSTVSATATITSTFSVTATSSVTVTTTTTVVATVTQAVQYRGPICNLPNSQRGVGGCSNGCYCDPRFPGGQQFGVCDTDAGCNAPSCSSDADCGQGQACATYGCPTPQCVSFSGCSSTFVPPQAEAKRSLEGTKKRVVPVVRREKAVEADKLLACRVKGIYPEQCEA